MAVTASGPFHGSCIIAVAGTAVQLTTIRTMIRHPILTAYDDNQGNIFIGIGSGVTSTKGTYGKMFRPGDTYEFVSLESSIYVDLSRFWINCDAASGFAGDGFAILNPAWE